MEWQQAPAVHVGCVKKKKLKNMEEEEEEEENGSRLGLKEDIGAEQDRRGRLLSAMS